MSLSTTDAAGRLTRYGYYADGRLKTLTDANGNLTTWERDIQGRITAKVYADGTRETYAYEPSTSRLTSRTDALGQRTDYGYAKDDRLTALDYVGALEPTPPVRFAFDPSFPRLAQMTDGQGVTAYQYHPVGSLGALRLAQEDGPFGNDVIAHTYDVLGRPSGRTVHDKTEVFEYDLLGRPTRHQNPLGDFRYTYLGDTGQPSAERIGTTNLTTWSYLANDQDRRLASVGHPTGLRSHAYTSDAYRITGVTETGSGTPLPPQAWSYQYDPADRLTLANGPAIYQYQNDPADNLTNQAGTGGAVNALNQLSTWNGQTLTHDTAGNLTQDASWQYRYDAENRLVTVAAQPPNTVTYRLRYDGRGRRVVETESATGTDTRLLWCGEAICQTRNASDVPTRYHYPQGELRGSQRLYYATDHLGSVREVRDLTSGQTVAAFDYTAYGAIFAQSGSLTPDYGFAGMWRHAPTGLYLTHYRAYSPAYGRWLTRDPIREDGGVNLYAYVGGNSINYVDPDGLLLTVWHAARRGTTLHEATVAGSTGTAGAMVGGGTVVAGVVAGTAVAAATETAAATGVAAYKICKKVVDNKDKLCRAGLLAGSLCTTDKEGKWDPSDNVASDLRRVDQIKDSSRNGAVPRIENIR